MTSSRAGPHTAPPYLSPLPMFPEYIADIQEISAKNNGGHLTRRSKRLWGELRHMGEMPGREVSGAVGALSPFRAHSPGTGTLPQETCPFSWKDAEQSKQGPGRFGSGRAFLSLLLATGQLSQATESWDSIREESSPMSNLNPAWDWV